MASRTVRGSAWGLFSRILAATFGGYGLASALAAFMASALPLAPAEAALTGMYCSILVWVGAVLWAFAAPDAIRAWTWIGLPSLAMSIALLSMRAGGLG